MAAKKARNAPVKVRADRRPLLAVLILPVLALATWMLFTSQQMASRDVAEEELQSVRAQVGTYQQKIDSIKSGKAANAQALLDTALRLDRQLPPELSSLDAIARVQRMGQQASVTMAGLKSEQDSASPNAQVISGTASGSKEAIVQFLSLVQNYEPLVTLSHLSVTYTDPADTQDSSTATAPAAANADFVIKLWHFPSPVLNKDPDVTAMAGENLPDASAAQSSVDPAAPAPTAPAPDVSASVPPASAPPASDAPASANPLAPAQP